MAKIPKGYSNSFKPGIYGTKRECKSIAESTRKYTGKKARVVEISKGKFIVVEKGTY